MHHLIFEGAELAGKSWLMSQVYDRLEPKYNKRGFVLDGCHWFNCDVGVYGTKHGKQIIRHYLKIFKELGSSNLLVEKFHLADKIYNRLHAKREIDYSNLENELKELNFKIILITFPWDRKVLESRIRDRLNIYPHYEKILRNPDWYIAQQDEYIKELESSGLDCLTVPTDKLPDQKPIDTILNWIGENS